MTGIPPSLCLLLCWCSVQIITVVLCVLLFYLLPHIALLCANLSDIVAAVGRTVYCEPPMFTKLGLVTVSGLALLPPCPCPLTPVAIIWYLYCQYSYWLQHIYQNMRQKDKVRSFIDAWPTFDFETCFESRFIYTVHLLLSWWLFSKTAEWLIAWWHFFNLLHFLVVWAYCIYIRLLILEADVDWCRGNIPNFFAALFPSKFCSQKCMVLISF